MSRSSNSLRASDVITTPIKLKYSSSYDCSTFGSYGITVVNGVNGPVTITGSVAQTTINYRSIRHLYYSNYLTGSNQISASSADNFLQSTAALGTYNADVRYFPTESEATVRILSIPKNVFGEQISRRSFIMTSSLYCIVDDGNGNLVDVLDGTYVTNSYYLPTFTDWYVYQSPAHVGNIIYQQGMVIITNPNYQYVLPYSPIAYPDTATFYSSDSPKTLSILSNDYSGSGILNTGSVVLSGGDVALFTNNLNGTVTLNATVPNIYTTYYTVESDMSGSCSLESNEATITVFVYPDPVTTTTTTTTVPTTTTTTTTSTTTTTTTVPATTTTTTSTSTTTTTVPATTTSTTTTSTTVPATTTSTTTTTTTVPATTTTTTSTTTTTTTNPITAEINVFGESDGGGNIQFTAIVTSGTTLDNLDFSGEVQRYSGGGCTSVIAECPFVSVSLPAGNSSVSSTLCTIGAAITLRVTLLDVNSNAITTDPQDIVISGRTYRITGFNQCTGL